jgi:hypothetical protein
MTFPCPWSGSVLMNSSKSARAVLRFVLMRYAVGVGVPLEVDEEVVEDAVVLEGWFVVFVSVVAVVPVAWFVSVFVAVSAVVGAGVVASSPPPSSPLPPAPPLPPLPPPAAPPAPVSDEVDVVGVESDPEPLSVVVPEALVIGAIVESEPETLSVVVPAIVEPDPEPLSIVVPEGLAADVIVDSEPEALTMVPVIEAVTVEATVVREIVPAPVCKLTHSASSVQKSPPQVKTSVPQQTKGTLKVSPTERVSIPGFAFAKHVESRKSSLATWLSEVALIEMSCPRVKPRSSTAAAARKKKWGIEACIESCRSK